MSLRSAVAIVLDEMEKEAKSCQDGYYQYRLRYLATHLKVALEASDSDQTTAGEKWHSPNYVPAEVKEKAVAEAVAHYADLAQKEDSGPRMVECVDGPGAGCFVDVSSNMPDGGFCHVAGVVYQLRGGKLHVHLSKG